MWDTISWLATQISEQSERLEGILISVIFLLIGIAIYWGRLGQLKNELLALLSVCRPFKRGQQVTIKAFNDPILTTNAPYSGLVNTVTQPTKATVIHDRGVEWLFCPIEGQHRAHVVVVTMNKQCYYVSGSWLR